MHDDTFLRHAGLVPASTDPQERRLASARNGSPTRKAGVTGGVALALLLAACGGGESAAGNTEDETAAAAPVEQIPSNLQQDPNNTVVPIGEPSPAAEPATVSAFPAAFQGRWGMVEADCDPAKAGIAKGLLVVAADRVTHYESRGTPTGIAVRSPQKIVADLAFTGEGQEWTRKTTFTLTEGGRTLLAEAPDDPEPPMRTLRYSRCPA